MNPYSWGTGRRKSSVARVRIKPGTGKILVNSKEMTNYFPILQDQDNVLSPLKATESTANYDVWVNVQGGGTSGQSGAILMGLARALMTHNPAFEPILRELRELRAEVAELRRPPEG